MKRRLITALALCLAAARAGAACVAQGEESAAVVAVTERLELRLDNGRTIRLAALAPLPPDFPASAAGASARDAVAAEWIGRPGPAGAPPDGRAR